MLKKFSFVLTIILILAFSVSASAAQESIEEPLSNSFLEWQAKSDEEKQNSGLVPFPVDLSYLADNPPEEIFESHSSIRTVGATIPSAYDLRNVNSSRYVTSVKNQNPYNTCWAFASIGAMESNYLLQTGTALDLSEMHLAWFTFKNSDKSKAFFNLQSASLSTVMGQGGHSFYPAALYGRLDGPALESDLAYGTQPSAQTPASFTRALRVRDVYYLNFNQSDGSDNVNQSSANRNAVKQRIMQNGSVVGSYYSKDSAYEQVADNEISYYFKGSNTPNHAVQIIGWDDNYSKNKFKTKPSSDGAWLIKNSWGTKWSNGSKNVENTDGCFWMSYEQLLTDGTSFIVEEANDDMKAYYYDALGWCSSRGFTNTSSVYAANVFKSERAGEVLTEVAFYTPDNNLNYEINVYTGMSSMPSSSPINGSPVSTASGSFAYAGYHTVTLDTSVPLTNDEYFSVVVKLSSNKIPVEVVRTGFSNNATIEAGSFISANGTSWTTGKSININTCVRAFTLQNSAAGIAPKITTDYPPDGLLNVAYSYKLSASGSRPLTWSSTGNLPDGLALDANTGILSGAPSKIGSYTFTISATNNIGSASKNFTMNIFEKPVISTTEITGYVGYDLSAQLTLSIGTATSWTITSGTLPKGLSLSSSTGSISGKPKTQGSTTITFTASTNLIDVSQKVKIVINPKPTKPKISTSRLTEGTIDTAYKATVSTSGTKPITLSCEGLPSGLTMSSSGEISGTPTEAGRFTVKIMAANIFTELDSSTVTKNVKLKINAIKPVFEEVSGIPSGILDNEYEGYKFELTQGSAPITWSASGLPKGITLSENGELAGTPTKAGTFKLTIKAKNSNGQASLKTSLTVYQIPEISTTKLANATTGKKYSAKISVKGTSPISWDFDGLPDTLTVTPNAKGTQATISGTPTEAATYDISVKASNYAGSDEQALSLTVNGVAPKIKASLAKGNVDQAYTGSNISAAGTLPIEFSYSISDKDKTKFGIDDLSDIGLTFKADASTGTAEITGTPNISIKNLPIQITATNVAGSATKKVNFTAQGTKPTFASSAGTITQEVDSTVEFTITVKGSKNITISMNNVNGLTLTQDDDYSATISGTAPSKVKKTNIKITAANADGKTTKTIVLQTTAASATSNTGSASDVDDENQADEAELETESENDEAATNPYAVNIGAERSIKALGKAELDALEGYTIAAVMPELSVSESGMYDFEVDLEPEIESEQKLFWFAFAKGREKTDDDEIVEFFDLEGKEITKTTAEHKILISVWLNAGDIYAPVIAVKPQD